MIETIFVWPIYAELVENLVVLELSLDFLCRSSLFDNRAAVQLRVIV